MRWLICLFFLSLPATAQQPVWPQLHTVTGVAANDVLNVRRDPSTGSEIVGTLSPDAKAVEVVQQSADGRWSQVNIRESSGWVASRFLNLAGSTATVPLPAKCYGTEPFWSLDVSETAVEFSTFDGESQTFATTSSGPSLNLLGRFFASGAGRSGAIGLVMAARMCSDGMSDRIMGIEVDVGLQLNGDWTYLSGCCSLTSFQ